MKNIYKNKTEIGDIMEYMTETKITKTTRFFENENYYSQREFFTDGIIDYDYSSIKFDFSNCSLKNEEYSLYSEEEYTEEDIEYLLSEEEEFEEIIEID